MHVNIFIHFIYLFWGCVREMIFRAYMVMLKAYPGLALGISPSSTWDMRYQRENPNQIQAMLVP